MPESRLVLAAISVTSGSSGVEQLGSVDLYSGIKNKTRFCPVTTFPDASRRS